MPYDFVPGVDESFRFAPEVMRANGVVALTTTQRNNLPASLLFNGKVIYNTTLGRQQHYNGAAWVDDGVGLLQTAGIPTIAGGSGIRGVAMTASRSDHQHPTPTWVAYAPSLTSGTIGSGGSLTGRYCRDGDTVFFDITWTLGTGFVISSNTILSAPFQKNPTQVSIYGPAVNVRFLDQPAGNVFTGLAVHWSTGFSVYGTGANGLATTLTATSPQTFSVNDIVLVSGYYSAIPIT